MNHFLSIYRSDTVHVFDLNNRGFFPFGIPTNADMDPGDERYPIIKLDTTYPGCIPNNQEPEMKFEIENGVPVPPKYPCSGTMTEDMREAMANLEIGQSFFVPAVDRTTSTVNAMLCRLRRGLKPKYFVSRKILFDSTPGLRIWRLE